MPLAFIVNLTMKDYIILEDTLVSDVYTTDHLNVSVNDTVFNTTSHINTTTAIFDYVWRFVTYDPEFLGLENMHDWFHKIHKGDPDLICTICSLLICFLLIPVLCVNTYDRYKESSTNCILKRIYHKNKKNVKSA